MPVTMNAFGLNGRVVVDPILSLQLDGSTNTYGALTSQYDHKEVIVWLLMQEHGIGMSEAAKLAQNQNTCLQVTDFVNNKELHFFYRTGYHASQLLMFA